MSYMAIYRLKDTDENVERRFMNMESLKHFGLIPRFWDYKKIYEEESFQYRNTTVNTLENIFVLFNRDSGPVPEGFNPHHSLSVGDVVVLEDSAYFCDSFGWKEWRYFYHALKGDWKAAIAAFNEEAL